MARKDTGIIRRPLSLHWYALRTRPRCETAVAELLESQATEYFLPLQRCRHTWKDGAQIDVDLPLFPCYLFVRISKYDRTQVLQTPGVLGFAEEFGLPKAIPDHEVTLLRNASENLKAELHPGVHGGDRVRIVSGPLRGAVGILTQFEKSYRVVLRVEAILRSVAVSVGAAEIEPAEMQS
jgi:transcription antitermination factor NusG